jgi:RNA polymerase sigma factor (sigma-70 family)
MTARILPERERMILAYQYLCKRGARKFLRPDVESCDLEQVAAIGLIKACDRYNGSLPTPFEAYAWMSITGELMNHLRAHNRASRYDPPRTLPCASRNLTERIALERAIAALSPNERIIVRGVYGLGLTKAQIASQLGLSSRHIVRLHRRALDALQHHLAD